jgi:adenylylsulfate kinase
MVSISRLYRESEFRSLLKAASWRFWGTIATSTIVYLFTGKMAVALTVGGLEAVSKIAIFFFHERFWDRIKFGKQHIRPAVLWFTGLSGSGKNELAQKTFEQLKARGLKVEHLDGDQIRKIFPHTGFSKEERDQHVGRVGYLASRLEEHGVFVIASLISPYRESRDFVRGICKSFVEVHVATPLEVCEKGDPKGLYARARRGEIKDFTGVDAPYEEPLRPELRIDLSQTSVDEGAKQVMELIHREHVSRGLLKKIGLERRLSLAGRS